MRQNDFIGTVVGGNPANSSYTSTGTDGTTDLVKSKPDGRNVLENVYNVLKGTATPHNCYGTSATNAGCDQQWDNIPESKSPKISNPGYQPPVVVPQYQQVDQLTPQSQIYSNSKINQLKQPFVQLKIPLLVSPALNSRLDTVQDFKKEQ